MSLRHLLNRKGGWVDVCGWTWGGKVPERKLCLRNQRSPGPSPDPRAVSIQVNYSLVSVPIQKVSNGRYIGVD